MNYGFVSLIPIIVVVASALILKKTFLSMLLGAISGFLILSKGNPITTFNMFIDALYAVLTSETTLWILLVSVLIGGLVSLMERSGGIHGFSKLTERVIKSRRSSLLGTWILGLVVFFDDYVNALVIGSAMKRITDKHKVSREMLGYIINSTGSPVAAIIPVSVWGAFISGQLLNSGIADGMSAMMAMVRTTPYIVYGWIATFIVPLFLLKIIPLFGPMKKAEERALNTGEVMPEASKIEFGSDNEEIKSEVPAEKCRAVNFLLPILLLSIITIVTEDMLIGVFAALILCLILYVPQRIIKFTEFFDEFIKGITEMFPLAVIIITAYILQQANLQLGVNEFVISSVENVMNPALLPVVIFLLLGLLSFASGSFWGLAILAFPIIAPLSAAIGANSFLCAGALTSAVCMAGQICMYSDIVILSSGTTKVNSSDYFRTSGPLVLVSVILSAIVYLVLGFIV